MPWILQLMYKSIDIPPDLEAIEKNVCDIICNEL